jgi:hypothetical protein
MDHLQLMLYGVLALGVITLAVAAWELVHRK